MNRDKIGLFSQLDKRWSRLTLGNTIYTIKEWGCTITSICMIIFYLFGDIFLPSTASKLFKFTKDGKLYWGSVKYKNLKFVGRYYGKPKQSILNEYILDPKKAMIVEVNYSHWVFMKSWTIPNKWFFLCGEPYKLPARFRKRTKWSITGYSLFKIEDE